MTNLGPYGRLHLRSLRQNRPDLLSDLRERGDLENHLSAVDQRAKEMFDLVVRRQKDSSPDMTEAQISHNAHRFVMRNVVLVPDRETNRADDEDGYRD